MRTHDSNKNHCTTGFARAITKAMKLNILLGTAKYVTSPETARKGSKSFKNSFHFILISWSILMSHLYLLIHNFQKLSSPCKALGDNTPNGSKNVLQILSILRLVGGRSRAFVAIS